MLGVVKRFDIRLLAPAFLMGASLTFGPGMSENEFVAGEETLYLNCLEAPISSSSTP